MGYSCPEKWKLFVGIQFIKIAENQLMSVQKINAQMIFSILVKMQISRPTAEMKLCSLLSLPDHPALWKDIFLMPQKVSVESTLQIFQYKTLNNILSLNKYLLKLAAFML